jgi:hypothetical protein
VIGSIAIFLVLDAKNIPLVQAGSLLRRNRSVKIRRRVRRKNISARMRSEEPEESRTELRAEERRPERLSFVSVETDAKHIGGEGTIIASSTGEFFEERIEIHGPHALSAHPVSRVGSCVRSHPMARK